MCDPFCGSYDIASSLKTFTFTTFVPRKVFRLTRKVNFKKSGYKYYRRGFLPKKRFIKFFKNLLQITASNVGPRFSCQWIVVTTESISNIRLN